MTDEEFMKTQMELAFIAGHVASLDLKGFLARIEHTHAMAPIVDPTYYRDNLDTMRQVERVARLALPLQEAAQESIERGKAELEALIRRAQGKKADS